MWFNLNLISLDTVLVLNRKGNLLPESFMKSIFNCRNY